MRALIAVAEHTEDPFKPICLQTLTEIRRFLQASYIRKITQWTISYFSLD